MKTNEGLMARKLPSQAINDALVPSNQPPRKEMDIPFDNKTAIRKLKKTEWEDGKGYESNKGEAVYVKFNPNELVNEFFQKGVADDKTATPIIVKFIVGQIPVFSTYIGRESPIYYIGNKKVSGISIEWTNPENEFPSANKITISFDDADVGYDIVFKIGKKGIYTVTNIKETDSFEAPIRDDGSMVTLPSVLEISNATNSFADGFDGIRPAVMEDEDFLEQQDKFYADGDVIFYMEKECSVYASPDMYVGGPSEDLYLLPPDVDFDNLDSLNTNQAIIFNLLIDNPTFSTNNYTGRNSRKPSTKLVETLIFPGDEALLAPSGYSKDGNPAQCGAESPEGRVLKSIIPAKEKGVVISVEMKFRDGSSCIFPDPETSIFSAIDKENGQLLKGVVDLDTLVVFDGNIKKEYEQIKEQRSMRNLNRDFNILVEDENLTRVISWYSGKRGEFMNVLVPDPDNNNKSIVIQIPMEA